MTIFIPDIIIPLYIVTSFIYFSFLIKQEKLIVIDGLIILNDPNNLDIILMPLLALPMVMFSIGMVILAMFMSILHVFKKDKEGDK